jgi:polysaccharide pyruvyl transferase WcaK-like protein
LLRTEIRTNDEVLGRLAHVLPSGTRTLVIGGYGCGNIGDEAILSVMLDDLRTLGVRPRVVSVNAPETTQIHDVRAYAASLVSVGRALFEADALVIGGGGIFSRYMGPRSRQLPPLAGVAKALRRRVVFRALGVYASTPPDVARALVGAMRRADFVSVRDEASVAALRSFGLRRDVVVEDDPALRLPAPIAMAERNGRTVGLALRRVRDAQEQRRLEREFVAVIDGLVERAIVPFLLPFSRHPSEAMEQDDAYAQELIARSRRPEICRIAPAGLRPSEMLELVRSLDGIVAMRFHAIVFASLAGVPAVAIPYDDKCRSFLEDHAMASVAPPTLTADAVLASLPIGTTSVAA